MRKITASFEKGKIEIDVHPVAIFSDVVCLSLTIEEAHRLIDEINEAIRAGKRL